MIFIDYMPWVPYNMDHIRFGPGPEAQYESAICFTWTRKSGYKMNPQTSCLVRIDANSLKPIPVSEFQKFICLFIMHTICSQSSQILDGRSLGMHFAYISWKLWWVGFLFAIKEELCSKCPRESRKVDYGQVAWNWCKELIQGAERLMKFHKIKQYINIENERDYFRAFRIPIVGNPNQHERKQRSGSSKSCPNCRIIRHFYKPKHYFRLNMGSHHDKIAVPLMPKPFTTRNLSLECFGPYNFEVTRF